MLSIIEFDVNVVGWVRVAGAGSGRSAAGSSCAKPISRAFCGKNCHIPAQNGHNSLSFLMPLVDLSCHTAALVSDSTSRVKPALLLVRVLA